MDKLTAALQYAEWGWNVIPVVPNGKEPATQHGVHDATMDPNRIREWWKRNPNFNIGIATGQKSGIIVFDIDPRNGGDLSWDEWLDTNGRDVIADSAMQLTAGGGRHYPAIYTPEIRSCKLVDGVDVLSDGRYFLAYPSTIEGRSYDWEADSDPFGGVLPFEVPPHWIAAANARSKTKETTAKTGGELIQGNRNAGLTSIAGAMRSWGLGRAEILAALSVTNELRVIPPLPTSDVARIAESVCRYTPEGDLAAEVALGASAGILKQVPKEPYYLTRATSFLSQPSPIPWAIRGWVPENGTTMIFGDSGIGKTFIAIDMACCIAAGESWAGVKTKPGVVVYLAGEGNWGLRQRVAAWCSYYGIYELDNLLISNKPIDLDSPSAAADVLRAISELTAPDQVVNVFIDTLNRHMSGDENSAKDVRNLLNACGVVSAATGGAITIIHHTGHGETTKSRERGSSALRGAMDSSLLVTREAETIKLECRKMKDAKEPEPLYFRIQDVDLGWIDEDGNPEPPAGVVVLTNAPDKPIIEEKPCKTEIQQAAWVAYRTAACTKGILTPFGEFGGLCEADWREAFYNHPDIVDKVQNTKKANFRRAKEELIKMGDVIEQDNRYFLNHVFKKTDYTTFVKKLQALQSSGTAGTNGTFVSNVPADKA